MARRVAWTNNSSGHSGTYVYRAPTLDPQNLPAPVATVGPVGQGLPHEWIDNEELAAGDYDYAVQDFDGQGAGTLSSVESYNVPNPLATATIGDEIGGGIYAGINTESDATQYYIIFATVAGELPTGSGDTRWKTTNTDTPGTYSDTDGWANTQAMISQDITLHPAAQHCVNYTDASGNNDYYLPSEVEFQLGQNIKNHPNLSSNTAAYRWTSTAATATRARTVLLSTGFATVQDKDSEVRWVNPVRRVPV